MVLYFFLCSWFKESPRHLLEPLTSDPRFSALSNGGGLLIDNVLESDAASYRCVSRNGAGETASSHNLKLRPSRWRLEVSPKVQVANLGSEATFACSKKVTGGDPEGGAGDFRWFRNGRPISRSSVVNGTRVVFIRKVRKEDAGVYQCFAEDDLDNDEGDASKREFQASAELRLGGELFTTSIFNSRTCCKVQQTSVNKSTLAHGKRVDYPSFNHRCARVRGESGRRPSGGPPHTPLPTYPFNVPFMQYSGLRLISPPRAS